MEQLQIRPWRPLTVRGLRLDKPGWGSVRIESVAAAPRLAWPWHLGLQLVVGRAAFAGPAGLAGDVAPTRWTVDLAASIHAELEGPVTGLALTWSRIGPGQRLEGRAHQLPARTLLTFSRDGRRLVDPGIVSGTGAVSRLTEATRLEADLHGAGVRVAALGSDEDDPAASANGVFGEPEDVAIAFEALWQPRAGSLDVPRWHVSSDAASLSGMLRLDGLPRDPAVKLSLDVDRVDFARLFRASALDQPLGMAGSEGDEPFALGSMALEASAQGRLADPTSFTVSQAIDFTPPRRPLPALARLRGDFTHSVKLRSGVSATIEVSAGSPDFVAISDVPPLFVRTLLLGEDASFFGHRGIDLQAFPEAVLTNWARGGVVRGASTITQQLAKNLFLTNDRRLGRKVQELCLALLLEATLNRPRILEIYLNVTEWGPDLFGRRPAARHYFGREPVELTPKQMAFLVALVPGPTKYQRSFASGTPSAGFTRLVDNLLAKLHSVQALSDDDYEAALAEQLVVGRPD